jgi:ribosome-associated protein
VEQDGALSEKKPAPPATGDLATAANGPAGTDGAAAIGAEAAAAAAADGAAATGAAGIRAAAAGASSRELALIAAHAAWDKSAANIVVQEVAAVLPLTDYFVIASGTNERQVDAISEAVEAALRDRAGVKPLGREGQNGRNWVLLDYGDIVVHIFQPQTREFYRLESIWNDALALNLAEEDIVQEPYPDWLARAIGQPQ